MTLCDFNKFPENLKDEKLVLFAQQGDRDAFTVLLHRYSAYIRAIVRSFDVVPSEFDDMLQEGYIGLYKAVLSYDCAKGSFKSFISVCSSRSIISALRRSETLPVLKSGEEDAFETLCGNVQLEPEQAFMNKEKLSLLLSLISDQLSGLELQVFSLYLEGISYGEIAKNVHKPIKSVDNAIARAKKKLIYCLH